MPASKLISKPISAKVHTLLVGMNAGTGNVVVSRKLKVNCCSPKLQFKMPFDAPTDPEEYDTVVGAEPPAGT